MTRQEVIDALKKELRKTYTIRTEKYEDGKVIDTIDTTYPNVLLTFNRNVIEAALKLLEEEYDI